MGNIKLDNSIVDVINRYLSVLKNERILSKNTLDSYSRDLTAFFSWIENSSLSDEKKLRIHDIDKRIIHQYVSHLGNFKKSPATVNRKLSVLRTFFNFLFDEGFIIKSPLDDIKGVKKPSHLPRTLSISKIDQILDEKNTFLDEKDPLNTRDIAMIELFYSSGMRLSELVNTDINDIDWDRKEILTLGKGNKERIVLIGKKAEVALKKYITVRTLLLKNKQNNALFLNKNGNRISQRGVQIRIKRWASYFDTNINLHPHKLRHSFATHVLESSQDLRAVQELLGHESLASTQIYTNLNFQHLANIYDKSHPRAKDNKSHKKQ